LLDHSTPPLYVAASSYDPAAFCCATVSVASNNARFAPLSKASWRQPTRVIIGTANRLLKEIFKTGYCYHKCGEQLSDIKSESSPGQLELFDLADNSLPVDNRQLMKVVDQINWRFPKAISVAATGIDKSWRSKAERVSQRYTTDWKELVCVKC